MTDEKGKFYIGDGVYLSRCPYGWVITANHHRPSEASDKVYLDPMVAETLRDMLTIELKSDRGHVV
jgi:hypothetical protein